MSDCHFDFCSDGSHGADHGLKTGIARMTPGKSPVGDRAAHLRFGAGFGIISSTIQVSKALV